MIDNHNSFRMHPISLEETWMMMRWPNHVFSFILAVSIVNVQNAALYFLNKAKVDALQSQQLIAKQLIQPLLAGRRHNNEVWKMRVIGIPKFFSRATAEVQDEIWQMEMH